jgi:hypothetical protein
MEDSFALGDQESPGPAFETSKALETRLGAYVGILLIGGYECDISRALMAAAVAI